MKGRCSALCAALVCLSALLPAPLRGGRPLLSPVSGTEQEWQQSSSRELLRYFPTREDAVSYIVGTIAIVKRKETDKYAEYRTKHPILAELVCLNCSRP